MAVTITPAAAEKTKLLTKEHGINKADDYYLRLGLKGGGCSGFQYDLQLDNEPLVDSDLIFNSNGVKIIVNEICIQYLDGTELDYEEKLYGGGYRFNNPNASRTCSCKKSFLV